MRVVKVRLQALPRGIKMNVTLTEVYLALRLAKNIVSYGKMEIKGFALVDDGEKRALSRRRDGTFMIDVAINRKVLYNETTETR